MTQPTRADIERAARVKVQCADAKVRIAGNGHVLAYYRKPYHVEPEWVDLGPALQLLAEFGDGMRQGMPYSKH